MNGRKTSDKLINRWVHLYVDLGLSCREIVEIEHNDYSHNTICRYIKQSGVKMRNARRCFDISKFVDDYNSDMTCTEIAEKYGFADKILLWQYASVLRRQGHQIRQHERGFSEGNKRWKKAVHA